MLRIDPELLTSASDSKYRAAFERGHRWLRFSPDVEREFQEFYTDAHLLRIRLAGYLAIVVFSVFVVLDLATLPERVSAWTAGIRVALILVFAVGIGATFVSRWRRAYLRFVFVATLTGALGTVAVIGVALRQDYEIPYEGILLVPSFLHLIVCLQWRSALLANAITLAAFIALEFAFRLDPQVRLYHIVFMCAASAIAAYAGYFLEYSTRTTFLVHSMFNEMAERDCLTGLSNRRTLNSHLGRVWGQGLRDGRNVTVVMIDVDHFKRYNDRYGHAQGDKALRAVADVIASHARRPLDLAARYGGEEFVLVWYHPDPGELVHMGERLRAGVEALAMEHDASEHGKLSISVGIASMPPGPDQSSDDLMRAADMALFQAKAQGRNQVVVQAVPPGKAAQA